uniref:Nudix hydrolase domain-containing protein n=1 Tax=Parastrongyloides trichosuri TaxID=131310 RepID=A0A0N4ZQY0_PARTI
MISNKGKLLLKTPYRYSSLMTEERKNSFIKRVLKAQSCVKQEYNYMDSFDNRFPNTNLNPKPGDSSVLIPLVNIDKEAHIIYTKRSMIMRTHKGQICFPGGKVDPNETWEMAALREAEEEIHLKKEQLDVWIPMFPVLDRGMTKTVTPIIAEIICPEAIKHLHSVTEEVDVVIAVPIMELATHHHYTLFKMKFVLPLPYYESSKFRVLYAKDKNYVKPEMYRIWGLTGALTHFFLLSYVPEIYKAKVKLPF